MFYVDVIVDLITYEFQLRPGGSSNMDCRCGLIWLVDFYIDDLIVFIGQKVVHAAKKKSLRGFPIMELSSVV